MRTLGRNPSRPTMNRGYFLSSRVWLCLLELADRQARPLGKMQRMGCRRYNSLSCHRGVLQTVTASTGSMIANVRMQQTWYCHDWVLSFATSSIYISGWGIPVVWEFNLCKCGELRLFESWTKCGGRPSDGNKKASKERM